MLLRTGPYKIDTEQHVVWQGEEMVRLPPRVIGVLVCLVEQRGNLTLKEELRARVWAGTVVEENSIAQVISLLRRELKAGFGDVEVIETVPRRGYRFTMEVVEEQACAPSPAEKAGVVRPEASMVQSETAVIPPQPAEVGTKDQPRHRTRLAWAFGLIVVAGTIFVGTRNLNRSAPPLRVYPLTDITYDEVQASISPDGKRVAYSRKLPGEAVYDLYVKEVGGPAPLKIAHAEADSLYAAWSPDGQLIAYSRRYPDHGEVRTVSPLGRGDQILVRLETSKESTLGWSPDGKALAYSNKSPTDGGIFLFSMETAQSRRLTAPPPSARDRYPRFSADGKMLAFARIGPNDNDVSGPDDLYVMPTNGGPERRVTAKVAPYFQGLTFNSAGDELVFASSMRGTKYLYRVPVSGGSPPTQAIPVPDAQEPSLARTMDRLVFGVYYSSAVLWRTTMGADDRKEVQLPGFRRMEPRISPDGKRLAFVADAAGFDEVWVANVDGSGARRLTSGGVKTPDSLAWSPDGRNLAYQRLEGERTEVWVVPTAGGAPLQWARTDGENASPSWSGDGKWLYFSSDRTGRREIWRQPWPTGRAEQVTRAGGYTVQHSPDGKYLYFTKPDSLRLFRMPVGGGDTEQIQEVPEVKQRVEWRVTRGGYYWYHSTPGTERTILFYDFATKKTRPAIPPNSHYAEAWETFDVAPDDSWIIWPAAEPPVRRIMVGEGFR